MNKVIEEIKEFIISLSGGPESAIEEMAEDFYDRIAPEFSEETDFEVRSILAEFSTVTAMSQDEAVDKIKRLFGGQVAGLNLDRGLIDSKEFPEEEFNKAMSARLFVAKTDCGHEVKGLKKLREDAKRLWKGTPENKGACPRCGGSKRVPVCDYDEPISIALKDCPVCTEQHPMFTRSDIDKHIVYGDERKGQRRVRRAPRVFNFHDAGERTTYYVTTGKASQESMPDRRDGKERRKGEK